MAYLRFAVPASTAISEYADNHYIRIGNNVASVGISSEDADNLPANYTADSLAATASDGLFMHTAGSYVLDVEKLGTTQFTSTRKQRITAQGGTRKIDVQGGDFALGSTSNISVQSGAGIEIETTNGKISAEAPNGKTSYSGKVAHKICLGLYSKMLLGTSHRQFYGDGYQIHYATAINIFLSLIFQAKTGGISTVLVSIKNIPYALSMGILGMKWGGSFQKVGGLDYKCSTIYKKSYGLASKKTLYEVKINGALSWESHITDYENVMFKAGKKGFDTEIANLKTTFP